MNCVWVCVCRVRLLHAQFVSISNYSISPFGTKFCDRRVFNFLFIFFLFPTLRALLLNNYSVLSSIQIDWYFMANERIRHTRKKKQMRKLCIVHMWYAKSGAVVCGMRKIFTSTKLFTLSENFFWAFSVALFRIRARVCLVFLLHSAIASSHENRWPITAEPIWWYHRFVSIYLWRPLELMGCDNGAHEIPHKL